jgi:hypothetical protein
MIDWNFKIKNDQDFKNEIFRVLSKYDLKEKNLFLKGQQMILETLEEIKEIVFNNSPLQYKKESYGNLLPYLEFKGGPQFLETEDGKDIIEIFFYFAYKWKSAD